MNIIIYAIIICSTLVIAGAKIFKLDPSNKLVFLYVPMSFYCLFINDAFTKIYYLSAFFILMPTVICLAIKAYHFDSQKGALLVTIPLILFFHSAYTLGYVLLSDLVRLSIITPPVISDKFLSC